MPMLIRPVLTFCMARPSAIENTPQNLYSISMLKGGDSGGSEPNRCVIGAYQGQQ